MASKSKTLLKVLLGITCLYFTQAESSIAQLYEEHEKTWPKCPGKFPPRWSYERFAGSDSFKACKMKDNFAIQTMCNTTYNLAKKICYSNVAFDYDQYITMVRRNTDRSDPSRLPESLCDELAKMSFLSNLIKPEQCRDVCTAGNMLVACELILAGSYKANDDGRAATYDHDHAPPSLPDDEHTLQGRGINNSNDEGDKDMTDKTGLTGAVDTQNAEVTKNAGSDAVTGPPGSATSGSKSATQTEDKTDNKTSIIEVNANDHTEKPVNTSFNEHDEGVNPNPENSKSVTSSMTTVKVNQTNPSDHVDSPADHVPVIVTPVVGGDMSGGAENAKTGEHGEEGPSTKAPNMQTTLLVKPPTGKPSVVLNSGGGETNQNLDGGDKPGDKDTKQDDSHNGTVTVTNNNDTSNGNKDDAETDNGDASKKISDEIHAESSEGNTDEESDELDYSKEQPKQDDGHKDDSNTVDDTKKTNNKQYRKEEMDAPSSGNFMAYFLTAVVLCIAGYVVFHNKQKIIAFIIEGRSTRQRRRTNGGGDYKKLQSNIEESV